MILYIVNGGALTVGTSSRKKIPRLKDELDEVKYDENDNMNLADLKIIISKFNIKISFKKSLLMPMPLSSNRSVSF